MDHYSLLRINPAGVVTNASTCDAQSDADALAAARRWTNKLWTVEVWKGRRFVGTVKKGNMA